MEIKREQLLKAYPQMPETVHRRMDDTLNKLRTETARQETTRRAPRLRTGLAVALAAVLLTAAAVAVSMHYGVSFFLTDRVMDGAPVDAGAVVQATSQTFDSKLLNAAVTEAYWDGEKLAVTLSISPKGDYAFYTETDRGCDGESFDKIWWQGDILPFEEWKAGREAMMLSLPDMTLNGTDAFASVDWVHSEQGTAMELECEAADMSAGAELDIELTCTLEGTNTTETAVLHAVLPPMKKGEPKQ